jgi:tetratricopeptide (TPR) repeat protein
MKLKSTFILLAFSMFIASVVGQEDTTEFWINKGMEYYNQGTDQGYWAAKMDFEKALSLDSSCSKALYGIGIAHNGMGYNNDSDDIIKKRNYPAAIDQYTEAIGYFEKAIQLNSSYFEAYTDLADSYNRLGRDENIDEMFDKALELVNKALDINPNYEEALNVKATIYYYRHDYKAALDLSDKSLEKDLNNSNAWYNKCRIYLDQGLKLEANEACGHLPESQRPTMNKP